jgi:hypothetical protein
MMAKRIAIILGVVECFVAILAIPAGLSMMIDPSGSDIGISTDMLQGTPFKSYFIPGLFLFIGNGAFQLICAMFSFRKHRLAPLLGILIGFFLLIWICMQVYFIGFVHFLQPVFFTVAVGEIVLGILLHRKLKQTFSP